MHLVTATHDLARSLAARIPDQRREVIEQMSGKDLAACFIESIEQSVDTYCGVDDTGSAILLGGVMPTGQMYMGYVWQVIGPDIAKHKRAYIEQSRAAMARGLTHYETLIVAIECEYKAAFRHMRRLGWNDLGPLELNGVSMRVVGVRGK